MQEELNTKYVGKFLGPNKIVAIEITDGKTSAGSAIFKVSYDRNYEGKTVRYVQYVSEKGLVTDISDKERDYTSALTEKLNVVFDDVVKVVEDYNLSYAEIPFFIQKLEERLRMPFKRALNFALHGNDDMYAPGWDPMNDASLLQAETVIGSIPKKDAAPE